MCCEEIRQRILDQTLGGEIQPQSSLAQHIQDCPSCRSFYGRLTTVDRALRALPRLATPAAVTRRILEQTAAAEMAPEEKFLPWTLWLPVVSLLAGIFWAYLSVVWARGPAVARSLDPTAADLFMQIEQWFLAHQSILVTVAISVTVGLLVTLAAIGLGLYVGRSRAAMSH